MEVQLSGENLYENREKKLKKYKEIALDEKNDWVQCYDKHDILVYSSEKFGSGIHALKIVAQFPDVSPEFLYSMIIDDEYVASQDKDMIEFTVLQTFDEFCDISYYCAKSPVPFISPRDFVSLRIRKVDQANQEFIILLNSVHHPERPEVSKIVRANIVFTFYLVTATATGAQLIYVSQTNLGGYIPTSAVNFVTRRFAPTIIFTIRKLIKEYEDYTLKKAVIDVVASVEEQRNASRKHKDKEPVEKPVTNSQQNNLLVNSVEYDSKQVDKQLSPFNLTPQQRQAFDEFNESIDFNVVLEDDPFCLVCNKIRFLKGYDWKVDAAKEMYLKAVKWRTENTPWRIQTQDIKPLLDKNIVSLIGKSKRGEPAFLIRVGKLENSNLEMNDLAKLTFYLCEETLRSLKPPQLTVVAIVDFKGFHAWSTFYSSELKEKILSPLVAVYPELLGKGYVINTPVIFEGLFKIVKPFLQPVTISKLSVDGRNYHKHLLDAFDPEYIPDEYRNEEMKNTIKYRNKRESFKIDRERLSEIALLNENSPSKPNSTIDEFILEGFGKILNEAGQPISKWFILYPGKLFIYDYPYKITSKYLQINLYNCRLEIFPGREYSILKKEDNSIVYEEFSEDGEILEIPTTAFAQKKCSFKIESRETDLEEWIEKINKMIEISNNESQKSNLEKLIDKSMGTRLSEFDSTLEELSATQQKLKESLQNLEKIYHQSNKKINQTMQDNQVKFYLTLCVALLAIFISYTI